MSESDAHGHPRLEVLLAFLKLGMTSFGGPIAHIGYFREEFVKRRGWIDDDKFTELVALCQFLPGPASSQLGFSMGLLRAGYWGGLAAWLGFTLPSAILLIAFAYGMTALQSPVGERLLHGLMIVAVAIVAQAVSGMVRTLCPDRSRASIAVCAALIVLIGASSIAQLAAIAMGGIAGLLLCKAAASVEPGGLGIQISRRAGTISLCLFFLLLFGLPVLARFSPPIGLFNGFYRSGALVFGGGHVVLPLLNNAIVAPGWVSNQAFLAGYGAAQALPGPLFTIAAYLGALALPYPSGLLGAALGLIAIFLPGMLVLMGVLPFWQQLRHQQGARAAMQGVNAAVVGLLAAALFTPLWLSAVRSSTDFAIALVGFTLLTRWRTPPLVVVALSAAAGIVF